MMRNGLRLLCGALLCLVLAWSAAAQDDVPPTTVYVTTQDFVSLRQGPGTAFNRLTVVPASVTLPAYGRTSDTQWVQVLHEGQRGWISSRYLVWSGDIIDLPVDGVDPYPFVRRAAAVGVTTRETGVYLRPDLTGTPVDMIPQGTDVELTGRLGGQGFFQFQVRWQGQLYWVGNWNIRITDGNYLRLLDLAYLYPYGRLVLSLQENVALAVGSFRQIDGVWARIARGEQVVCAPIPPRVAQDITDEDVLREPLFAPAVASLGRAIANINAAIDAFSDACAPGFALTADYVQTQRVLLADAARELLIAGSFLEPLDARNPLLDTSAGGWTGGY
jgi:hypothetical protein